MAPCDPSNERNDAKKRIEIKEIYLCELHFKTEFIVDCKYLPYDFDLRKIW